MGQQSVQTAVAEMEPCVPSLFHSWPAVLVNTRGRAPGEEWKMSVKSSAPRVREHAGRRVHNGLAAKIIILRPACQGGVSFSWVPLRSRRLRTNLCFPARTRDLFFVGEILRQPKTRGQF